MSFCLFGREWGPGEPCIVAEISCNHNGSLALATSLIRAATEAGVGAVKFQCYTVEEIVALRGSGPAPPPWERYTLPDLYERAQTPQEWFPALVSECGRLGVPWFSSVFGPESLALLESLGCPAYKVAALDRDSAFALELSERDKPLVASSPAGPVPWADVTLFCPPGYPQDWDGAPAVPEWADGLSYHGTDAGVPIAVVRQGAGMVEAHLHLADHPGELDGAHSLTEHDFAWLCDTARKAA